MKDVRHTNPFRPNLQAGVPSSDPARRHQVAAVILAWTLISLPWLQARDSRPGEYEVKAAYLYNFGRFVEWPIVSPTKGEPFTLCVLGRDPFGPILDATLADETIHGSKVLAKRISRPQDAVTCRILFISSSEADQLKEILATLDKTSVLTVSDIPEFVRRGGMVEFVLDENKVRFEINVTSAERAGLALSSELLKVAVRVEKGVPPAE